MARWLPAATIVVIGLILIVNFVVINPTLATAAAALQELTVLLAAAAAIAGAVALVLRHWHVVVARDRDRLGSWTLLAGMALMLAAGLRPGSNGVDDPAVRWLVTALLAPLVASVFALLFLFLLRAASRGMAIRSRETTVMLASAAIVIVLLLPVGGTIGDWLAGVGSWALEVPIGAVFRGLLIGISIATAIHAARLLLSLGPRDE
jgi:uncharacterized membrane protein YhaH (DUF805 family)